MKTDLPILKINLFRGDDEAILIEAIDETGKKADFNGFTIDMDCFDAQSGEFLFTLSTKTGEISYKTGEIIIEVPHSYTKHAEWICAVSDIQLTDPKGKIKTIAFAEFYLEGDITGNQEDKHNG